MSGSKGGLSGWLRLKEQGPEDGRAQAVKRQELWGCLGGSVID